MASPNALFDARMRRTCSALRRVRADEYGINAIFVLSEPAYGWPTLAHDHTVQEGYRQSHGCLENTTFGCSLSFHSPLPSPAFPAPDLLGRSEAV